MPIDPSEVSRLAAAGALVAGAALPLGLVAAALRPRRDPLLPPWRPFPVPWGGFQVAVAVLAVSFVAPLVVLQALTDGGFFQLVYGEQFPAAGAKDGPPELLVEAAALRMLWANLFALPLQVGGLLMARNAAYPGWRPRANGSVFGKVALAVAVWFVLAPAVLALNAVVNLTAQHLGFPPETHPLAKLGDRPVFDRALLVFEACVGAPLREEVVIRGIMLWWCVGRLKAPGIGVGPGSGMRPWLVLAAGGAFAALGGKWQPVAFAAVLAVGLGVLWKVKRTGARRARAVYATAAFFALVHATWPNPIPLFVLGLGLGWLAVRTNGLLVPVLVHALFNAVSVLFVLRGG